MERINSGIYTTTNDFGEFTDIINKFINKLYASSISLYRQKYISSPTGTFELDISKIEESLGYIDDYLFYYYQFHYEDFPSITMTLIKKLQSVTVLPPELRGLYGQYEQEKQTIYINPQLTPSQRLSSNERTRLYICHELGHIQNSNWMDKVESLVSDIDGSDEDRYLMYHGFSLLDEATTQDRAETITYYYSSKIRPFMSRKTSRLFDGTPFETNFDYYGEYQEPAISFARTLRGIGKINNREEAMEKLDVRALKEDFAESVFNEYRLDGQITNLHKLLKSLGIIKNAGYAVFNYAPIKYLHESATALKEYNELVSKMRDYREPRNI